MKKTVIIGATTNSSRYAYIATHKIKEKGHNVVLVGIRKGEVAGIPILDLRTRPSISEVHTVTLYINAQNQSEWEEYILSLEPKRIIFNPGAENFEFSQKAKSSGIEVVNDCSLVMLNVGNY